MDSISGGWTGNKVRHAFAALLGAVLVTTTLVPGPAGAAPAGSRPITFTLSGGLTLETPGGLFTIPIDGSASGTIAGHDIELPASGVVLAGNQSQFQGLDVFISLEAAGDLAGVINPDTGALDVSGALLAKMSVPAAGVNDCPIGPTFISLSTPNGYDEATGEASLADNQLVLSAVPGIPACGGPGIAGIINSSLGLEGGGSTPGQVTLAVDVVATPRVVDHQITGRRGLLTTNASGSVRTLTVNSNDPVLKQLETDPRAEGGSVRIITATTDKTFDLPSGGWTRLSGGYRYLDAGGTVTKVKIFTTRGELVVTGKGTQLPTLASNPGPVTVVLSIGNENFCARFGGRVTFVANSRFAGVNAPRPAACPA